MADDIRKCTESEIITVFSQEEEEAFQNIIDNEEHFFLVLDILTAIANDLDNAIDEE